MNNYLIVLLAITALPAGAAAYCFWKISQEDK